MMRRVLLLFALAWALCAGMGCSGVGFGAAAKLAKERQTRDYDHVEKLWKAAVQALGPGWTINGSTRHRYPGNLNIRREGLDGARLIADLRDIAFSLGSARFAFRLSPPVSSLTLPSRNGVTACPWMPFSVASSNACWIAPDTFSSGIAASSGGGWTTNIVLRRFMPQCARAIAAASSGLSIRALTGSPLLVE